MDPDLRFCWVPPAGFEPATHGLGRDAGRFGVCGENPYSASDLRGPRSLVVDLLRLPRTWCGPVVVPSAKSNARRRCALDACAPTATSITGRTRIEDRD